jgi:hypothetical protein
MVDNTRSRTWFRLAVVYFSVAVALGIAMGLSGNHSMLPVHAHLNLLGWVSMTLFGLIGMAYPAITEGRIASLQFWLHNTGVPLMLATLSAKLAGLDVPDPAIGIPALVVGIGVLMFAYLVLTRLSSPPRVPARHS